MSTKTFEYFLLFLRSALGLLTLLLLFLLSLLLESALFQQSVVFLLLAQQLLLLFLHALQESLTLFLAHALATLLLILNRPFDQLQLVLQLPPGMQDLHESMHTSAVFLWSPRLAFNRSILSSSADQSRLWMLYRPLIISSSKCCSLTEVKDCTKSALAVWRCRSFFR